MRRASIEAAGLSDRTEYLLHRLVGEARDKLIGDRRGDVDAVKAFLVEGIDADDLVAITPYPPDYDFSRGAEVCVRAIEEIRSIELP